MMQQIAFNILKRVFWQNPKYTSFLENNFVTVLIISTVLTVIFGIAVYFAVEEPCGTLLSKFGKKLFAKNNESNS